VDFYSKLPKGPAPARFGGIKGRFFSGKNASGAPVLALIGGIFLIGYTLDYQRAYCSFFKLQTVLTYPILSLSSSYWYPHGCRQSTSVRPLPFFPALL
jgi:hypothetical protein